MMKQRHPTLPPLSTDGCTMTNNLTYSNYKNTNFSSIFDESPINATMTYFQQVRNQTIGVQSLLNRNILYILISICKRFSCVSLLFINEYSFTAFDWTMQA